MNTEGVYRQVYEDNAPLLLFLKDLAVPAPRALAGAAEYVLNASFKREFEENTLNLTRIQNLVDAAKMHGVALEDPMLELTIRSRMERIAEALGKLPSDLDLLRELDALASLLPLFPFEVNLRIAQNIFFQILREMFPVLQKKGPKERQKGCPVDDAIQVPGRQARCPDGLADLFQTAPTLRMFRNRRLR